MAGALIGTRVDHSPRGGTPANGPPGKAQLARPPHTITGWCWPRPPRRQPRWRDERTVGGRGNRQRGRAATSGRRTPREGKWASIRPRRRNPVSVPRRPRRATARCPCDDGPNVATAVVIVAFADGRQRRVTTAAVNVPAMRSPLQMRSFDQARDIARWRARAGSPSIPWGSDGAAWTPCSDRRRRRRWSVPVDDAGHGCGREMSHHRL